MSIFIHEHTEARRTAKTHPQAVSPIPSMGNVCPLRGQINPG